MNYQNIQRFLNLNHGRYGDNVPNQIMWNHILNHSLIYMMDMEYKVEKPYQCFKNFLEKYAVNWDVRYVNVPSPIGNQDNFEARIYSLDNASVMHLIGSRGEIDVTLNADTEETLNRIIEKVQEVFPKKEPPKNEQAIDMDFWYMTTEPNNVTRKIEVPCWEQVKGNYTPGIQADVEELLKIKKPTNEGKLIIFNGLPGCGKTFLLRTLLWEWRDWAKGDFVLDPEVLFSSPSYLLSLVLDMESDFESGEKKKESKWRILILEDADNYISTTAKTEYGQQVSRLLNLLDGLVGQGLNIMVVLTANEEHHKIHDAIKRPGRCLKSMEFDGFSREQAITWLQMRGLGEDQLPKAKNTSVGFRTQVAESYSLAELFKIAKENNMEERKDVKIVIGENDVRMYEGGNSMLDEILAEGGNVKVTIKEAKAIAEKIGLEFEDKDAH
jgi:SpoVK/Ycf46/Vps4 family AAA+-type ATPase